MSRASTRLVANLDAEEAWALQSGPRRPRPALTRAVRERISAYGTLMRGLARGGADPPDRLWTPAPVDPTRLPDATGPGVALESGPPPDLEPAPEAMPIVSWADTSPWSPRATSIAARANDRRFGLELARRLGTADPLAREVASPAALSAHLYGAARGVERWVVKAPFSAAGRARFLGGRSGLERLAASPAVRRLFHQHGPLVFEPWHERTLDFGFLFEVGAVGPHGPRVGGALHRLWVDPRGGFRGVEIDPAKPWLSDPHRRRLEQVADGAALALAEIGYRGPAGLDLWLHRPPGAPEAHLHAVGEINARLTFGHLARAWLRHLAPEAPSARGILLVGGPPSPTEHADGEEVVPLLHPSSPGSRDGAWMLVGRVTSN